MPRLGNILSDSDVIAIPTPDGDIHIEYYPNRATQKMANKLRAFSRIVTSQLSSDDEMQKANQKIYKLLLHLIKSWDLEDDIPCGVCDICKNHDNESEEEQEECQSKKIVPFPLQADRLDDLPVWLIIEVTQSLVSPNQTAPQKTKKS